MRYCREQKDVVAGLDHFCTWLNTSIGRSNYVPFYLLATFGTLQYAVHVAICVYISVACPSKSLGVVMRLVFGILALAGTSQFST